MRASSPVAWRSGEPVRDVLYNVVGTEIGRAISGTGAGSLLLQLSIARAIGTVYVFGAEWKGEAYEANSMVLATAPTAWLTVPVLTCRLFPKAPVRTLAAKPVVMMLQRILLTCSR